MESKGLGLNLESSILYVNNLRKAISSLLALVSVQKRANVAGLRLISPKTKICLQVGPRLKSGNLDFGRIPTILRVARYAWTVQAHDLP